MAQYNKYESYKFEYFEPKTVSTSNAAPKIKEQPKKAPQLKLLENNSNKEDSKLMNLLFIYVKLNA